MSKPFNLAQFYINESGSWIVIILLVLLVFIHVIIQSPITYILYFLLPLSIVWIIDKSVDRRVENKQIPSKDIKQYHKELTYLASLYAIAALVITSQYTYVLF